MPKRAGKVKNSISGLNALGFERDNERILNVSSPF